MAASQALPQRGTHDKPTRSPLAAGVELGKNTVAFLRDLVLFILVLLLLVFPGRLNTILTNAGFEEGSLVGFKWKANLLKSDEALKEARATIARLTDQLKQNETALNTAQARITDTTVKSALAEVQQSNDRAVTDAASVQASVSRTIAATAPLVEAAEGSGSDGPWGVVFSGDTALAGARHEIDVEAPRYDLPNPTVYLRDRMYRSVSVVTNRAEAQATLARAKKRRADAYVVSLSRWCGTPIRRDGFVECTS